MTPPTPINPKSKPRLLISVRNPVEALAALVGDADIIDVKDPARGPLGMADITTIREVIAAVSETPITCALGDLTRLTKPTHSHAWALPLTYLKQGLAHAPTNWRDTFAAYDPARFVPVAYADHARVQAPTPHDILQWAITHRCAGFLIDTAVKDGSNLFDHLDPAPFVTAAREANLTIALAGSLRGDSFTRAIELQPDIVAVRGAACAQGDRAGIIDADKVRALREVLSASHGSSAVQPARSPAMPV